MEAMLKSREDNAANQAAWVADLKSAKVPLVAAAANNDIGQILALLAGGADPNEVTTVPPGYRATAVGIAAMAGHAEALVLLVKAGGKPQFLSPKVPVPGVGAGPDLSQPEDPMMEAALGGHVDCLNVLLAAPGCDATADIYIVAAAQYGFTDAVKTLLAAGVDPDACTEGWSSATGVAARNGDAATLRALIGAGADVNKTNGSGSTPVYLAAQTGSADAVELLVAAGADLDAPRNTGATPCLIAAMHGHTEALKALIAGGADVKKSTGSPRDDDMSPAEYAAQEGHGDCLKLLLANGAAPPREWGVEEGESVVFNVGKGFNMIFKTSCSTSE